VKRDDAAIASLRDAAESFWLDHVVTKTPPTMPLDRGSLARADASMSSVYPDEDGDAEREDEVSSELREHVGTLSCAAGPRRIASGPPTSKLPAMRGSARKARRLRRAAPRRRGTLTAQATEAASGDPSTDRDRRRTGDPALAV
jgi:hypothetical protein